MGFVSRVSRLGVLSVLGLVVLTFGLMQLVPYRVTNRPTTQEPPWDSAQTRTLTVAACYACHSNQTQTYWWEDIAPLSWWITSHVDGGRNALNFSECHTGSGGGEGDAAETVRNGSMPPNYYTWLGLHSEAKLTTKQRKQLADGLTATLQGTNCGNGG